MVTTFICVVSARHYSVTDVRCLMLFKETTTVYSTHKYTVGKIQCY